MNQSGSSAERSPAARLVAQYRLECGGEGLRSFGIGWLQWRSRHAAVATQHSQCRLEAPGGLELLSQRRGRFLRAARFDQLIVPAALIELAYELRCDAGQWREQPARPDGGGRHHVLGAGDERKVLTPAP